MGQKYKDFEGRVDQLTQLVEKMIRVLFQSKGALFDKLIEQKQLFKTIKCSVVSRYVHLAILKHHNGLL